MKLNKPIYHYFMHPITYFNVFRSRVHPYFYKNQIIKSRLNKNMLYKGKKRDKKLIVSLTSYPARFEVVHLAIKSIMLGSLKPDKIILWLSKEEVTDISLLPTELINLKKNGLDIRFVDENIMPHTKYFYAMQAYPDDIIVTVDDDLLYPKDLLSSLYKSYLKHPDCVNARRVHVMLKNASGLLSYDSWENESKRFLEPSYNLFAVGVGGVIYPPHCMDEQVFDLDSIKKYCLKADDVWLKAMQLKKGTKVVYVPNTMNHPPVIENSQKTALYYTNCENNGNIGMNDIYIKNMKEYLGIDFSKYALTITPPPVTYIVNYKHFQSYRSCAITKAA